MLSPHGLDGEVRRSRGRPGWSGPRRPRSSVQYDMDWNLNKDRRTKSRSGERNGSAMEEQECNNEEAGTKKESEEDRKTEERKRRTEDRSQKEEERRTKDEEGRAMKE